MNSKNGISFEGVGFLWNVIFKIFGVISLLMQEVFSSWTGLDTAAYWNTIKKVDIQMT